MTPPHPHSAAPTRRTRTHARPTRARPSCSGDHSHPHPVATARSSSGRTPQFAVASVGAPLDDQLGPREADYVAQDHARALHGTLRAVVRPDAQAVKRVLHPDQHHARLGAVQSHETRIYPVRVWQLRSFVFHFLFSSSRVVCGLEGGRRGNQARTRPRRPAGTATARVKWWHCPVTGGGKGWA